MSRIVFLLEEHSMKVLLEGLLPRYFPTLDFLCIAHEGKQDLERSVPRKLRAWREPGVRFIVVMDSDSEDCLRVKERLVERCAEGGRPDSHVRIACRELEAWYLGDPRALADAFENEKLAALGSKARFRDPDAVDQPARALADLAPAFQKVSGARRLARHLHRERNGSRSFRLLMDTIARSADSD